jgi:hypothetical protein
VIAHDKDLLNYRSRRTIFSGPRFTTLARPEKMGLQDLYMRSSEVNKMMEMLKQQLIEAIKMREELAQEEAKVLMSIFNSYKNVGFTEEQAFKLLIAQSKSQ